MGSANTPIPPSNKGKHVCKISALSNANLMLLLLEGTYSCEELAEHTGLHYVTVLLYTRALYKVGAVHISSWEKDSRGRDVIKIYKLGQAKDAKRERMTDVQKSAKYRQARKAKQHNQVMAGKARYVKAANGRLRFEII